MGKPNCSTCGLLSAANQIFGGLIYFEALDIKVGGRDPVLATHRRILLDRARRKAADKRGGKVQPLDLAKSLDVAQAKARELVALDDALNALAEVDPRKSRIIELRFFGGLSVKETAEVVK